MKPCTDSKESKRRDEANARARAWHAAHREEANARRKAYYEANREAHRAYCKAHYETHKVEHLAANKARYEAKKQEIIAASRAYRNQDPEKWKAYVRDWKAKNADQQREYRAANKDLSRIRENRRRARKNQNGGSFTQEEWQAKCEEHGYKCYLCGKQLCPRTVVIEHVVPVSRGGRSSIDNLMPACKTCNHRKYNKTPEEFLSS